MSATRTHCGHPHERPPNGHNGHDGHHGPPPPRTGWRRWTGPGWLRVLWMTPLDRLHRPRHRRARSAGPPTGSRSGTRRRSSRSRRSRSRSASSPASEPSTTGSTTLRQADAARGPLRPRRPQLARLLPPEHRPQGDRRSSTSSRRSFFFVVGGLLAMLFRAELAEPGTQYFNPQTFNVLDLEPRGADDLPGRRARSSPGSATS